MRVAYIQSGAIAILPGRIRFVIVDKNELALLLVLETAQGVGSPLKRESH